VESQETEVTSDRVFICTLYPQLHPIFYLNIFSLPNVDCSYWNVRFAMHKWYGNVQGAQRLVMWPACQHLLCVSMQGLFKNTSFFFLNECSRTVCKVQQESIWILFSFKRDLSSCLMKYCNLIFEWILRILVWWASPLLIFSYQPAISCHYIECLSKPASYICKFQKMKVTNFIYVGPCIVNRI